MRILACVGAMIAALLWLVGTPLIVLAGVPFLSDGEYFLTGVLSSGLGLGLMPVAIVLRKKLSARATTLIRTTGIAVCCALILSGVLLALGASGKLGTRAPDWISSAALVSLLALFLWIGASSIMLRGSAEVEVAVFWLGLVAITSLLLPLGLVAVIISLGFTNDNLTVLPVLFAELLTWLALPAWCIAIVALLWPQKNGQRVIGAVKSAG